MAIHYDTNQDKKEILALAIKRAMELPRNHVDSVEDAIAVIKEKGIKHFVGGKIGWASTEEGTRYWSALYDTLPYFIKETK